MRPELVFFIAFSLLGTQNWSIFGVKFNFEILFFIENILILRKITLKVNKTSRVHTKLQSSITPRKKRKSKKFLILNSTLEQLFNDTTHISLRRIYRSAKID